jgi:hypothetical protein
MDLFSTQNRKIKAMNLKMKTSKLPDSLLLILAKQAPQEDDDTLQKS